MGHPDPIAFTIFGIDIRWYGILIACGMLLAVFICCRRAPAHDITEDDVLDIAVWMLPLSVVGARLYYVIFNHSIYHSLHDVIDIRSGGLAIHGGLIFGIAVIVLMSLHKKLNPLNVLDLTAPAVALAQAIGRWGNFFNGEAHGGPTDLPWAILVDGQLVHPTFLYESLWCLILFFLLSRFDRKKRTATGQTFSLYVILYSVERFLVEALRTDSLMIGPFKQAQVISLCAVIFGIFLYRYSTKNFPLGGDEEVI